MCERERERENEPERERTTNMHRGDREDKLVQRSDEGRKTNSERDNKERHSNNLRDVTNERQRHIPTFTER